MPISNITPSGPDRASTSGTAATWFRLDAYEALIMMDPAALRLPRALVDARHPRRREAQPGKYHDVSPAIVKLVGMVLAKFATFGTGQNARPGIEKTIAKLTGVGPRRVKFALRILEFHGVIRETHKARRDRSTTYRVVIGRAGADRDETPEERAAAETEARRVQVVRATYVEALKRRHGHDEFPKPVSVKAWVCRIEPIAKLAESAGLSFDQAAAAVWREYMREDGHEDGKLVARCHPPTWLSGYLPAIIERITKRAASDAQRAAERPAEEPPPVNHQTYADGAAAALAAIGVGSAHERSPERRRS